MRNKLIITLLTVLLSAVGFGQESELSIDLPLGLRIKRNGQDYLIYADQKLEPNFNDFRKINYQVYFRIIEVPVVEKNGKKYQLITIPGSSKKQLQSKADKLVDGVITYPRSGLTVNQEDYDQNFWIEVEVIEKQTIKEYYKYANDVFSGVLTVPFKYRLKLGNAKESLFDGDLNIAPFIGWKWRISSTRQFYFAPFGFAGVTSLTYNSANNLTISDPEKTENGTGLTYGAGISFRFGNVSPGFVIGWDKGFGSTGSGFVYNDKAWISFSINYDFFKANKSSEGVQN